MLVLALTSNVYITSDYIISMPCILVNHTRSRNQSDPVIKPSEFQKKGAYVGSGMEQPQGDCGLPMTASCCCLYLRGFTTQPLETSTCSIICW